MGLPVALKAHGEGNLALAETHYKRALEQKQLKPVLFQNYGALLRGNGESDEAKAIYRQGLELYPFNVSILRNYANLLRERGEVSQALNNSLKALRLACKEETGSLETIYCECINLLREQGAVQWAVALLRQALESFGATPKLLWEFFRLSGDETSPTFDASQSRVILQSIEANLPEMQPLEQAEFLFLKAFHQAKRQQDSSAIDSIRKAQQLLSSSRFRDRDELDKAQKLLDVNSWNASCVLLKAAEFEAAWKLFEWGLRAPAPGRQRWQRAVKKLFTHEEVAVWRGESLKGRRLLLLEEQAIGDTMMFLTLLPTLVEMAHHVGILLSARLVPIYQRSCQAWIAAGRVSIWSHEDAAAGRMSADAFDCQSPVGSVCQYIANHIVDFAPNAPVLAAKHERASSYRMKTSGRIESLRIGISWRGGGRSDRIKLKSIDVEMLAGLMRDHSDTALFVNLQYGDVRSVVSGWQAQGLPVVNEPDVNPLKDMEGWLNLVASCDAVISVANTTIHGAGGLNIPTLCLLSRHADWRWLNDSHACRSYWYPSVGIARESDQEGWTPALQQVSQWIHAGCPMPDGPVHTETLEQSLEHASV